MKKRIRFFGLTSLILAVTTILVTSDADAVLMMSMNRFDTSDVDVGIIGGITVVDNDASDTDATPDRIQLAPFSDMDGLFVSTGSAVVSPLAGPLPEINVSFNFLNFGVVSRYELKVTGTDLADGSSISRFFSAAAANVVGEVLSVDTYVDDSNTAFGTATHLANFGPASLPPPASSWNDDDGTGFDATGLGLTSPFSMTVIYYFEKATSFSEPFGVQAHIQSEASAIPEPSSMALGIWSFLLLATYIGRRKITGRK